MFFENRKILGFCYVKADQYKTRKEKAWIKYDTQNSVSRIEKSIPRHKNKKITPQASLRIDPKDCVEMAL